jgi:hypothetical protein
MYLDGDVDKPTIAGTGTEDYIGTGWGQDKFANKYTGSLISDSKLKQWAYYRYHIPDPVFFENGCRVTLQQIGGTSLDKVTALQKAGVPLIPVTLDNGTKMLGFYKRDSVVQLATAGLPIGWVNFYRSDDVSATAYFYSSAPAGNLPALQPVSVRTYNLKTK